jgi:hypothetical protein
VSGLVGLSACRAARAYALSASRAVVIVVEQVIVNRDLERTCSRSGTRYQFSCHVRALVGAPAGRADVARGVQREDRARYIRPGAVRQDGPRRALTIKSHSVDKTEVTSFSVEMRDGRLRTYRALRTDGSAHAKDAILAWPIQEEHDRSGNSIPAKFVASRSRSDVLPTLPNPGDSLVFRNYLWCS